MSFDPNAPAGSDTGIFGLPWSVDEAELVLLPVPWDVTVSYAGGTSEGPRAIREASAQVDLFLKNVPQAYHRKIAMADIDGSIRKKSKKYRKHAEKYIDALINDPETAASAKYQLLQLEINMACDEMNVWVQKQCSHHLKKGKLVGLIGGDHSTPLGFIKALGKIHPEFSILQIDAHCDLREGYEGFTFSHASIMYNALREKQVKKLVQVGIRDWCEEEDQYIRKSKGRVMAFYDEDLKTRRYKGETWDKITDDIISKLGDKVYISFDIDGLDPKLCPNTGTPVPGGLEFYEALYLIKKLNQKGKKIIGFDLVEVAPGKDEWDANTGARMIWQMAHEMLG